MEKNKWKGRKKCESCKNIGFDRCICPRMKKWMEKLENFRLMLKLNIYTYN